MYHSFEITTQSGSGGWGRCPARPRTFTVISVHHTQIVGVIAIETSVIRHQSTVCVGLWVSISQLPTADGYCENRFICYRVLVIFSLLGQFISISVDCTDVHNSWPMKRVEDWTDLEVVKQNNNLVSTIQCRKQKEECTDKRYNAKDLTVSQQGSISLTISVHNTIPI